MATTYTILKTRRGRTRASTGTLEELIEYFGYTLEAANSYGGKINTNPKTANDLINNLNKATSILQSGSFDPDYYELG